jgi:cytochrome b6-f complex iron-sulfur subunit
MGKLWTQWMRLCFFVDPSGTLPGTHRSNPTRPGRRAFVETILGMGIFASLGSFLYPVLRYVLPPPSADLGTDEVVAAQVGELKPNAGKVFRFGSRPGLLVRTADGDYRAMSAKCTHLDCTVQYRSDLHQVWCACHNGTYDLNGRNVSGPPPRPLQAFDVHTRGSEVVVRRRQES